MALSPNALVSNRMSKSSVLRHFFKRVVCLLRLLSISREAWFLAKFNVIVHMQFHAFFGVLHFVTDIRYVLPFAVMND